MKKLFYSTLGTAGAVALAFPLEAEAITNEARITTTIWMDG